MYTNRILATSGVALVLLTAGVVVAIRVFAAPAREDGDGPKVDRQVQVLDLAGANQLRITMNGGSLTGRVEGVGNVRYSGEASSVNVDTDGIVRIRRR